MAYRDRPFKTVVRLEMLAALLPVCALLVVGLIAIGLSLFGSVALACFISLAGTWVALVYRPEIRARSDRAENFVVGRRAEELIEAELEPLKSQGWLVAHDLQPGFRGNIDHVVCGPTGAFAIDTKTTAYRPHDLPRIRGRAKWVSDQLGGHWVIPVICLATRRQEPVERDRVWLVGGSDLRSWLESRRARPVDPTFAAEALGRS